MAILSTSQDSCMSYSAFVESPTTSEVMSDYYFSMTSDGSSSASKPTSVNIESPREITFGFPESALEYPKFIPQGGRRIKSVRRFPTGARTNSNGILRRGSDGPLEDCVFTSPNLELIPPEGGEIILGSTESGYNSEENRPKKRESGAPRRNLRLLMQQSIDEGMSGIMNRVVTERQQLVPPRAHTAMSPVSGYIVPKLQALVCSPTQSAERRYPQFVFTPDQKSSVEKTQSEALCQGNGEDETDSLVESNGSVDIDMHRDTYTGEKDVHTAQDPADMSDETDSLVESNGSVDIDMHRDTYTGEKEVHTAQDPADMSDETDSLVESNGSVDIDMHRDTYTGEKEVHTAQDPATYDSTRMDSSGFQDEGIDYLPYNHRKTSKATPIILFETELIVYPHFQTSAGLYPSFIRSDYFSSEMDMFESLSTLMAIKLSGNGQGNNTAHRRIALSKGIQASIESLALSPRKAPLVDTAIPHPTVSVLISPARRSRLIDQAAQAIKLKRPHSFNLGRDQSTRRDVDSVCLIPSARRDRLIQQAAWAIRKRCSIQQHPMEDESQMDPALHHASSDQDKTAGDFTGRRPSTPVLRRPMSSVSSEDVTTYRSQSAPVESNTTDKVPEHTTGCGITNEPIECTDSNVHIGQYSLPDTTTEVLASGILASGMSQSPSSSSMETLAAYNGEQPRTLSDVHSSPKHSINELLDTHNHSTLTPAHRSKLSFVEATGRRLSSELIDPKLNRRLLETGRSYKSMEVLAGVNGEILCTSSAKRRPITLLVCNKQSSQSMQ